jgi:threonylcarbamoyladenosine tRNA methylthiotransferase MtaB
MIKVITVGCRLNQAEGDQLLRVPTGAQFGNSVINNGSQVHIINTCAVTKEAVRTSWKMIRRSLKSKIKNQKSKLIVTGCLTTIEREKLLNTPGIDLVITQDEKVALLRNEPPLENIINPKRSRPVVKVQDGCPNDCSFCIARIIRGKPKSVTQDEIRLEIARLVNLGYQEIVLTGLNLGYYGIDFGSSLTQLLKSIPDRAFRIRLSSIEPDTITDELLELWSSKRLCRHLHVPLQSGDSRILKLMHRKYTPDDYSRLIDKIISSIDGVNIGADIIVGFPYEDESAFLNTLKLARELPFGYLHIFPYSPRPWTEAAKLPDTVAPDVKKERVHILREIALKKKAEFVKKFIGNNLEILVEDNNIGISDNYIRVPGPSDGNYKKGQLYNLTV